MIEGKCIECGQKYDMIYQTKSINEGKVINGSPYGSVHIEVTAVCPKCKTENTHGIGLVHLSRIIFSLYQKEKSKEKQIEDAEKAYDEVMNEEMY